MQWKDVLKRKDLAGGEIRFQDQESGQWCRGLVKEIKKGQDYIIIRMHWVATNDCGTEWHKLYGSYYLSLKVNEAMTQKISDNGIFILRSIESQIVIFPKTDKNRLDPRRVTGLSDEEKAAGR